MFCWTHRVSLKIPPEVTMTIMKRYSFTSDKFIVEFISLAAVGAIDHWSVCIIPSHIFSCHLFFAPNVIMMTHLGLDLDYKLEVNYWLNLKQSAPKATCTKITYNIHKSELLQWCNSTMCGCNWCPETAVIPFRSSRTPENFTAQITITQSNLLYGA